MNCCCDSYHGKIKIPRSRPLALAIEQYVDQRRVFYCFLCFALRRCRIYCADLHAAATSQTNSPCTNENFQQSSRHLTNCPQTNEICPSTAYDVYVTFVLAEHRRYRFVPPHRFSFAASAPPQTRPQPPKTDANGPSRAGTAVHVPLPYPADCCVSRNEISKYKRLNAR